MSWLYRIFSRKTNIDLLNRLLLLKREFSGDTLQRTLSVVAKNCTKLQNFHLRKLVWLRVHHSIFSVRTCECDLYVYLWQWKCSDWCEIHFSIPTAAKIELTDIILVLILGLETKNSIYLKEYKNNENSENGNKTSWTTVTTKILATFFIDKQIIPITH